MADEVRSSGFFDKFATSAGRQVERPWFFALCAAFVVAWIILLPLQGWNNDVWHLWLNSPTTSITFLLVALLQNTQARSTKALHHKLDAMALALALVLEGQENDEACVRQLREMAGVEMESSK